jgi:hypothetical protein
MSRNDAHKRPSLNSQESNQKPKVMGNAHAHSFSGPTLLDDDGNDLIGLHDWYHRHEKRLSTVEWVTVALMFWIVFQFLALIVLAWRQRRTEKP